MKYEYAAVFFPDDGSVGVKFYDADWYTCGDDLADAIDMAQDLLGGRLMRLERAGQAVPKATALAEVVLEANQTVRLIAVDTEVYARELEEQLRREEIARADNPIKAAREYANLNIKQVAELLGAPYRTVQDWNAGIHTPPEWLQKLIVEKIESAR